MLVWIIALLGIFASFLVKYINKKDKTSTLSISFWFKDNLPELSVSVIFMVILMIIALKTEFDSDIIASIPLVKSLPMDLISAALIGYLNNHLFYSLIKKGKEKLGIK